MTEKTSRAGSHTGDLGPSWWDVGQYVEHFQETWGFRPLLGFVAPYKNPVKQNWSSWGVSATKPILEGKPTSGITCWGYFGRGGQWKTAPAAAYAALSALETELEMRRTLAEGQASF